MVQDRFYKSLLYCALYYSEFNMSLICGKAKATLGVASARWLDIGYNDAAGKFTRQPFSASSLESVIAWSLLAASPLTNLLLVTHLLLLLLHNVARMFLLAPYTLTFLTHSHSL